MKNAILHKATDLFLSLGFKSVTMDDLAREMGISKKTIYTHFPNKTALVSACTMHLFETINHGISLILNQHLNPIAELINIKEFVMTHLKNEQSSPQYQLQKYYPKIHDQLKFKQLAIMESCVIDNLTRGIQQSIYRKDINLEFISRIYFTGMNGIKDLALFPTAQFSVKKLMELYLSYHLRAICTDKGLETYLSLTKQNMHQ